MDELEVLKFESGEEGPNLLVTGAIHGDEICGPIAIRKIIQQLENKEIVLNKGSVTFLPVCNPKAHKENVRFIDRNLNRYMFPKKEFVDYEDHLTNQICSFLENADVLLDLHSYQVGGKPFIFIGKTEGVEFEYAQALGAEYIVYGWSDAYEEITEEMRLMGMGTTEYLRTHNGYGVTFECGQHLDANSPIIGEQAILNALSYLKMIAAGESKKQVKPTVIRIIEPIMKPKEGRFTEKWQNFQSVKKGTHFASFEDGEEVIIPRDGVLVLPKESTEVGAEWAYLGEIVSV